MRAALIQMTSGDDPAANLAAMADRITEAAAEGAGFVLTPEFCNCVSLDRQHQQAVLRPEAEDTTLAGLRDLAARLGLWLLAGSLALKTGDADGRFANRSFVIGPDGGIVARYDKIHIVRRDALGQRELSRISRLPARDRLVTVPTPFGVLGLTICYDLRFPHIFRAMAQAGAEIFCVPSAFAPETGAAHWEPLLRSRAIENGAYVLAPAQTGTHPSIKGRKRVTYGHSLAVNPWGKLLEKSGGFPHTLFIDFNISEVARARRRIPSLMHDRPFQGPI